MPQETTCIRRCGNPPAGLAQGPHTSAAPGGDSSDQPEATKSASRSVVPVGAQGPAIGGSGRTDQGEAGRDAGAGPGKRAAWLSLGMRVPSKGGADGGKPGYGAGGSRGGAHGRVGPLAAGAEGGCRGGAAAGRA